MARRQRFSAEAAPVRSVPAVFAFFGCGAREGLREPAVPTRERDTARRWWLGTLSNRALRYPNLLMRRFGTSIRPG